MLIFKRRDLNSADELTKLADLRDRGVITDDEFQKGKAPIAGLTRGSCSTKQESAEIERAVQYALAGLHGHADARKVPQRVGGKGLRHEDLVVLGLQRSPPE
jgi:Short C-terminal domain